mgnify:CR=1 FL=1
MTDPKPAPESLSKFYDVDIDSGSPVRLEVSVPDGDSFNPYQYLDIRKWFTPSGGSELVRTRKGIHIKLSDVPALCQAILSAYSEATGSHLVVTHDISE